ncbi:MAG: hypothetical protein PHD05_00080 [Sphaerochaetaceae bacterium]|jgi:hypothetical protein|nr:hypothetical protein [Sphaerochaetaceae bacterium]
MNIQKLDIRQLWKQGEIVCVTTNGFIKKNGDAVMGRGNAKAMADIIPRLPTFLALHIKKYGNVVGPIYQRVLAFPVKPIQGTREDALSHMKNNYGPNDVVPGFFCKAQINIIEKSMEQLNNIIVRYSDKCPKVYLPIPGVNNGQINFEDIKSILERANPRIVFIHQ